mmetsp:Transcript_12785/g.30407  ORF Transcript_12785/g.30407 Transcript_12785/m.30407 type:complete len:213 (-) Transcript_12785:325-963(-)
MIFAIKTLPTFSLRRMLKMALCKDSHQKKHIGTSLGKCFTRMVLQSISCCSQTLQTMEVNLSGQPIGMKLGGMLSCTTPIQKVLMFMNPRCISCARRSSNCLCLIWMPVLTPTTQLQLVCSMEPRIKLNEPMMFRVSYFTSPRTVDLTQMLVYTPEITKESSILCWKVKFSMTKLQGFPSLLMDASCTLLTKVADCFTLYGEMMDIHFTTNT